MGNSTYIAKQPILDTNGEVFAYELLYRDTEVSSNIKNRKQATVSVLSSAINKFGVNKLLGEHKAFVKADPEFIMHNVIETIPKEYFIFALQFDEE
ncbi:MAG: diguanylate phosphodiesterase, partial [Thiovulaceae bacterium]|nr:diguanylate phosphodiesterase [Sulfurimonadaceae bacterium]